MATNNQGQIRYIDPQNHNSNCSNYFDNIKDGSIRFVKIDNADTRALIKECYRVEKW